MRLIGDDGTTEARLRGGGTGMMLKSSVLAGVGGGAPNQVRRHPVKLDPSPNQRMRMSSCLPSAIRGGRRNKQDAGNRDARRFKSSR